MPKAGSARLLPRFGVPLALGLATLLLYGRVLRYGLLGHDSYPILLTARIRSLDDLWACLSQPLMDGRFEGAFYRPLLDLSFALDEAIWGLNAFGYQLTDLAALWLCAWALHALLARMLGGGAWVASLVLALVFLGHPSHWESLPVPSRRSGPLCCCFLAMAVRAQLAPAALERWRPAVTPALWAAAAALMKENGYVAPGLCAGAALLWSPPARAHVRLARAAAQSSLVLLVCLGLFWVRSQVLEGVGGYDKSGLENLSSGSPISPTLFLPQPAMRGGVGSALWILLAVSGLACLALGGRALVQRRPGLWCSLALGLAWMLGTEMLNAYSGKRLPWYLVLPVAGSSLALAVLAQACFDLVRLPLQEDDERLTRWLPAGVSLGCSSVLAVWSLSFAPCIRPAQEWERAEERRAEFLSTLEERIAAAPLEGQMLTTHIPMRERQDGVGTEIIGAQILMDYTVQAWCELIFPERELHAVLYGLKIPWKQNRTGLWIVLTLPEDAAERAEEKFMSESELRERLRRHVRPED